MQRQAGKLGKLEAQRPELLADLIAYAQEVPQPPLAVDFTVGILDFEMALNDQEGDCTIAGVTHMNKSWSAQTKQTYLYPGDPVIDTTYKELTGGPDTGLVEADVLSAWKNTGLFGKKIVAYAPVNVSDLRTMKAALNLFGGLYIGVQLPGVAMSQFEAGQAWDLTKDPATDNDIEGGHCVTLQAYNEQSAFKAITWGAVQTLTLDWLNKYCDEAWAIIPEEYQDAAATMGIDMNALDQDLTAIAHQ